MRINREFLFFQNNNFDIMDRDRGRALIICNMKKHEIIIEWFD